MKTLLIILALLIISSIVLFFVLGIISKSGNAPGMANTKLLKCLNKPNCVCSEYQQDQSHYVAPIIIKQNSSTHALAALKTIIENMGGNIHTKTDLYLAATFTSAIFRFVDDLEIRIDSEQSLIHIRSASRVGRNDAGVNKHRIELLKKHYHHHSSATDH